MNLTDEMKQLLLEREMFEIEVNNLLNIRPAMVLIQTGGKPSGTFDLRSLNKAIIENAVSVPPRELTDYLNN